MKEEIVLKELRIDEFDLKRLKILLEKVGAEITFENLSNTDVKKKMVIQYDTDVVRRKMKREAGRKRIQTGFCYTIGEVKEKVKKEGLDEVLKELNISESTYFRRMRYYKQEKISEDELFD